MRALLLVALVASASAYLRIPKSYHDEVGIPEALRIKAAEDIILEDYRIVGGSAAPVNAHPYLGGIIISLIDFAGNSVCSSSLISPNRLVTAAHCWFDGVRQAWQFEVVLGSQFLFQGGTRIATRNVVTHPQYKSNLLFNDVAIINLLTSVALSNAIRPIALPSTSELMEDFVGARATAAGYGRTSDQQTGVSTKSLVSNVNLQVISIAQCQTFFPSNVIASTLCTSGEGGVGVCGGDSGGPLVLNRGGHKILIGVTSFVAQMGGTSACQRDYPSGFARVTSFHSFITQHL